LRAALSSDLVSNSKDWVAKRLHTGKFIIISWGNNPLKQSLAWFLRIRNVEYVKAVQ